MNVSKATQVHSVTATSMVFVTHSFVKMEGLAKRTLTNTLANVLSASPVPTARLSFLFVSHYHATTDIKFAIHLAAIVCVTVYLAILESLVKPGLLACVHHLLKLVRASKLVPVIEIVLLLRIAAAMDADIAA